MENAVDALKMAWAVLVFVIALSITMFMFSQARTTADAVLQSSDITEFMEYQEASSGTENRIVGLETIIPTLYKYYKENYTVIFRDSNGNPIELYKTQTNSQLWSPGYGNKYYNNSKSNKVCSFDVDEETRRHEPWTGNTQYYKQNLDTFLKGGKFYYPNGSGEFYDYGRGFIDEYRNSKFIEDLGEYTYNTNTTTNDADDTSDYTDSSSSIKEKKKRVIIYTLQN